MTIANTPSRFDEVVDRHDVHVIERSEDARRLREGLAPSECVALLERGPVSDG
ncbi:hypothetical protein [Aeromicrobium chenweiae]|uniref:hypothetical protein n=1 Tax=Aeromicrobium chenweiae TaxID=2079793 RepID=UPI00131EDC54|nr:hypothetical protein [Aeromicrobium chenweiae]